MERDAPLTFMLDDGLYEAPILRDVRLEEGVHTVVGRWTTFGFEAEGDSAAEVYRDLLSMLMQRVGNEPSAPSFQPLAALMRERGRRLPADEIIRREDEWLREVELPWTVSVDDQYRVALFKDVDIQRGNGEVSLCAFGITRVATELTESFEMLRRAISEACGSQESPGPRFIEISSWVAQHGRRVAIDEAARESLAMAELVAVHDGLIDIAPEEVRRLGSTDTLLLVQFWGNHCGWCTVQAPVLAELADELIGRVVVRKINADRHGDMARRFEVHSVPTVLLLRGGRELHRIHGHRGKKTIMRELREYVGFDS